MSKIAPLRYVEIPPRPALATLGLSRKHGKYSVGTLCVHCNKPVFTSIADIEHEWDYALNETP